MIVYNATRYTLITNSIEEVCLLWSFPVSHRSQMGSHMSHGSQMRSHRSHESQMRSLGSHMSQPGLIGLVLLIRINNDTTLRYLFNIPERSKTRNLYKHISKQANGRYKES